MESSFFPIPPDVMLAPMSLAQPNRALWFATITTVTSVAGGLFGYVIGMYFFELIEAWLQGSRYWQPFLQAQQWFNDWGFWAILIAGFSPIPYKAFTIAAGVVGMPLIPFALASLVGRGGRFYLVAGLMKWGGQKMESQLKAHIDLLGWLFIALVIVLLYLSR